MQRARKPLPSCCATRGALDSHYVPFAADISLLFYADLLNFKFLLLNNPRIVSGDILKPVNLRYSSSRQSH